MSYVLSGQRCPVCGKKGFRKMRPLGGQIIGWCRENHPYIVSTPSTKED